MARLANLFWRALSGTQAHLASGNDRCRRYAPGFPPIIAFADPAHPDFQSLAQYCEPGDRFYVGEWRGSTPPGWTLEIDSMMCAMVLEKRTGSRTDLTPFISRLAADHVPQMIALAAHTKPGPFAQRPMEIGEWYGVFEGERLVAMAGERAADGNYREISGVCTLPEYQGRGYATEAATALVEFALSDPRVQTVRAHTLPEPNASTRVLTRNGFRHLGEVMDPEDGRVWRWELPRL